MDLGIVIVSYNTRQLTLDCLASVTDALAAEGLDGRIWVVDNASPDGSAQAIAAAFPQVTLIASAENLGFARGTNLGLEALGAQGAPPCYVLLLNPDTLVSRAALPPMLAFMESHARVGVVGPALRYGDGRFQHSAFRFPTLAMAFFDFYAIHHRLLDSPLNGRYPRARYASGRPFPIDHPLGAAMLTRWETLQQVGPLDAGYFMYCEEIDWCLRAKKAGWEIYCVPAAQIVHLGGQSAQQFRERMFVALWQSRYRLFAQHYSPAYGRWVRRIVRAGLRRKLRETKAALRSGQLSAEQACQREDAYRLVMEM
ncbi:MAG: glycosyltransferase family 2 protein [Chloroflexota bacterium]